MTKVNPNNETKSDIFPWEIFKSDTISFLSKHIKSFNGFQNENFSVLYLKWTQTMEMKQNHIVPWDIFKFDIMYFFIKTLKYFNDFQNWNFSVLWLKWNQTEEMKQNQTFFHWTYLNQTHISFYQNILKYFTDFQNRNFSVSWLNWTQAMDMKQNQAFFHGICLNLTSSFFGLLEGPYEIVSVRPSILSVFSSVWVFSWNCIIFSKFWHHARNPFEVLHDRAKFSRKFFLLQKDREVDKKWAKIRVFSIYRNILSLIFLNLFYNVNLCYLLCSYTNPMFGNFFSLRYGPKSSQPIRLLVF